jgi:plastocyanin
MTVRRELDVNSSSHIRRSTFIAVSAALAVVLVATACSSSKKSSANAGGSTPQTTANTSTAVTTTGGGGSASSSGTLVHVKNFAFNPKDLSVSVGTKVTWEFDDSTSHNVTASDNSFSSDDLNSGAKFSFTFNKAGTYSYMCTIHPQMKATVVVK